MEKHTQTVNLEDGTNTVRTFRCYNIKHSVGIDTAANILDEMLAAVDLQLELSGDYDEEIYDLIEKAKVKQLERDFSEVTIVAHGTIEDDDIEDFLSDEISNATNFLHEGFEYEEVNDSKAE